MTVFTLWTWEHTHTYVIYVILINEEAHLIA
jgi:hypothetical protein